jgi:hypothetical protein
MTMTRRYDPLTGGTTTGPVASPLVDRVETSQSAAVSDAELLQVIKDFLDMGHVDTIVAMFHRGACPFDWTGAILDDERFNVRLGVAVLFEELLHRGNDQLATAIPSLLPLLASEQAHLRGDAVNLLGIIATPEALDQVRALANDPHPLVREIVADILSEQSGQGERNDR